MKDVAPHDRPREKLMRLGPSGLGDNELLALVLNSGSRGRDALALANRLLEQAGGVHGLTRAGVDALRRVDGIGEARAAQVLAAVELGRRSLVRGAAERPRLLTPRQVAAFLLPLYGARAIEQFGVVLFDARLHVLRVLIVAVGSVTETIAHPREVFREAAAAGATSLVLFHNHPSGDPSPSPEDVALTARLAAAGQVMDIEVADHLILADAQYYSMRERGLLRSGVVHTDKIGRL